jgi:hypothetical protein
MLGKAGGLQPRGAKMNLAPIRPPGPAAAAGGRQPLARGPARHRMAGAPR